jgi:hypothetical protein
MRHTRTSSIRSRAIAYICASALLLGMSAVAGVTTSSAQLGSGAAKPGLLKGNPTKKRLATEFLRLLKAKDKAGLNRFLDPAFLLQRGDGSYLNKKQYLADPSKVDSFKVRNIVATRKDNVRVIRFEANTVQVTNGEPVPGGWIPRLSTFVKSNGAWRLISHANFLLPPT